MNIKAIFMDLDRTLLLDDGSVSQYTLSVLNRCRERGIKLAFATARSGRSAKIVSGFMEWDGGIAYSGTYMEAGGVEVARAGIGRADALAAIEAIEGAYPGVVICAEVGDLLYATDGALLEKYRAWGIKDSFEAIPEGFVDMLSIHPPEDGSMTSATLEALLPPGLEARADRGGHLLVTHREATKLSGVVKLLNHWGIPLLYAAAFGDDLTDMTMLQNVGWGIAVANALPVVQAAADYVCGSCQEDGVARWLEENVLA